MFDNVLKHFTRRDIVVFFVAFCVGVLFVCLVEQKPEVIVRWPTPDNAGLVTYVDRANNCYEYEPKEVGCTDDAKHIPVQNGEGMTTKDVLSGKSNENRHSELKIVVKPLSWEKSFV